MTTASCPIKILNKIFEIKCPEQETANLKLAAEKLNGQLAMNKRKFKQLDDFQNLILASLHLSHELVACQRHQEKQRHQVTQFISSLENKISQAVNGNALLDIETD